MAEPVAAQVLGKEAGTEVEVEEKEEDGGNPGGLARSEEAEAAGDANVDGKKAGSEINPCFACFQNRQTFNLTESCKLVLHSGDITKWFIDGKKDAIVNAANQRMLGGGGVDGAIHSAAGKRLLYTCRQLPEIEPGVRCRTGEAVVTDGFDLRVAKVIHTVGPVYGVPHSEDLLSNAYESTVQKAVELDLEYLCFPAISCGMYAFPLRKAADIAFSVLEKKTQGLREVHFVLFDEGARKAFYAEAKRKFKRIED